MKCLERIGKMMFPLRLIPSTLMPIHFRLSKAFAARLGTSRNSIFLQRCRIWILRLWVFLAPTSALDADWRLAFTFLVEKAHAAKTKPVLEKFRPAPVSSTNDDVHSHSVSHNTIYLKFRAAGRCWNSNIYWMLACCVPFFSPINAAHTTFSYSVSWLFCVSGPRSCATSGLSGSMPSEKDESTFLILMITPPYNRHFSFESDILRADALSWSLAFSGTSKSRLSLGLHSFGCVCKSLVGVVLSKMGGMLLCILMTRIFLNFRHV